MVHKASGIEMRIEAALGWARAERDRCEAEAEKPGLTAPETLAQGIRGAAFSASIEILEEVLEPGKHSRGGPST